MEAFKGTVQSLWARHGGVTLRDIDDNLFWVVFREQDDLERVFVKSP